MFEQFEVAIWFTKFFFLALKVRNWFTEKMFEQFEVEFGEPNMNNFNLISNSR